MFPNCNHLARPVPISPDVFTGRTFSACRPIVGVGDQHDVGKQPYYDVRRLIVFQHNGSYKVCEFHATGVALKKRNLLNCMKWDIGNGPNIFLFFGDLLCDAATWRSEGHCFFLFAEFMKHHETIIVV